MTTTLAYRGVPLDGVHPAILEDPPIEHGTYRGRLAHSRQRIPSCAPCRDAAALYMFQRRRRNMLSAAGATLEARPDLRDLRAPVARFLAGVLENA